VHITTNLLRGCGYNGGYVISVRCRRRGVPDVPRVGLCRNGGGHPLRKSQLMRNIPIPMRLNCRERLQFRFTSCIGIPSLYIKKQKGAWITTSDCASPVFNAKRKMCGIVLAYPTEILARTLLDSGCSADSLASWHSTWEGRDRRPYSLCISELQCAGGYAQVASIPMPF
jgi:hypothetical protein